MIYLCSTLCWRSSWITIYCVLQGHALIIFKHLSFMLCYQCCSRRWSKVRLALRYVYLFFLIHWSRIKRVASTILVCFILFDAYISYYSTGPLHKFKSSAAKIKRSLVSVYGLCWDLNIFIYSIILAKRLAAYCPVCFIIDCFLSLFSCKFNLSELLISLVHAWYQSCGFMIGVNLMSVRASSFPI